MPFTPYHFGPHSLIAIPLYKYICWPTFLLSNVCIDLQPLFVMLGLIDSPLHGISHTFLIGGLIGVFLGICSIPLRKFYFSIFKLIRFPYYGTPKSMILSGFLGAWFHVLTDAPIYSDIHPFFPFQANPLHRLITYEQMATLCLLCLIPALMIFVAITYKTNKSNDPTQKTRG